MKRSLIILSIGAALLAVVIGGSSVSFKEVTIPLPWFGYSQPKITQPILIDVFQDGRVEVDNKLVVAATDQQMGALQDLLKAKLAASGRELAVIVRPDSAARQERIIDVLNATATAGIKNLTFS